MAYFEFPHTRSYDGDLGYIIKKLDELNARYNNFFDYNSIKFHDPINWSIGTVYTAFEIVYDPNTEGYYISKIAVPAGIDILNTDFWLLITPFKLENTLNINSINPVTNHAITERFIVTDNTISNIDSRLRAETTARQSGDNTLTGQVNRLSASVNTLSDGLTGEITNRTNADTTINARIDAIISGASVDPDAELIDIRVGADGQTYASAGAAVRGQVDDLQDEINGFYDVTEDSGSIFVFDTSDNVLKVVAESDTTVGTKNILPNGVSTTPTVVNGVTFTKNADGSITASGRATANASVWINQTLVIPRGYYTLSGCPAGGGASTYRLQCAITVNGADQTFLIDTGLGHTRELTSNIDHIKCSFIVFAGAEVDLTLYPQLEYGQTATSYTPSNNQTVTADTDIPITAKTTIFSGSSFDLEIYKFGWGDDIARLDGEISTINGTIEDIDEVVDNLEDVHENHNTGFSPDNFTFNCVHHDNFSRIMEGWAIGMNAGGDDTANNYEYVTAEDYDDGLTVNEGATFEAGTRTYNFSLRKIATAHSKDFSVEVNTPTADGIVTFGYNVTDINNFTLITANKRSNGYGISITPIINGSYGTAILNETIVNYLGEVLTLTFYKQHLYVYIDDELALTAYVGAVDEYLYLAAYKGNDTHFDFINVFDIIPNVLWNPNYILDQGEATIPYLATSANEGGYTLENTFTRWSNYADKFVLHSTDEPVHNGIRAERSIANMPLFVHNLRNIHVTFDVYFPSTSVDTQRNDIMFQMHDRDGTYRGYVPFIVNYDNNLIKISLSSTHAPKDGADDVHKWVTGETIATVTPDTWHHFEFDIKERYDEDQHPFTRFYIDSILVFESRLPNCYNDVAASSPQYGIYKNLWGTGVTTFERYFDNLRIKY